MRECIYRWQSIYFTNTEYIHFISAENIHVTKYQAYFFHWHQATCMYMYFIHYTNVHVVLLRNLWSYSTKIIVELLFGLLLGIIDYQRCIINSICLCICFYYSIFNMNQWYTDRWSNIKWVHKNRLRYSICH